jgi:SAM-dependent methyltransferase
MAAPPSTQLGSVPEHVHLYDATYGEFDLDARRRVRLETYGEDIGQNGWLTAEEWRTATGWLAVGRGSRVLDVACGSGGPAVDLARRTGATLVGVDVNGHAIAIANELARRAGLDSLTRFEKADAARPLPFDDGSFGAVVSIDAINHLADRSAVLADWYRLLGPGGSILFTDPIVVTGLLSSEEIALRTSIGFLLFSLRSENERLVREAGFELIRCDDSTDNVVEVASRWRDARARQRMELIHDEGKETFEGLQRFLAVAHTLAAERRLSRYTILGVKEMHRWPSRWTSTSIS